MNRVLSLIVVAAGLAMGQSVASIPAATGGGGGGPITGCGTGMTLNGTVCDYNPAVITGLPNLQSGVPVYCAGSASTTATCGLTPALTAYTTGQTVLFKAGATNTTTNTLNIDSLGAKSILTAAAGALAAGDVTSGNYYLLTYDGTQFRLPASGSSTAPNFSQTFWTGSCTASGGTFYRLMMLDGTGASTTCYSGYYPTFASMNVTGTSQYIGTSVPVATAVASLKVGVLAYSNSGSGTVKIQTACSASGSAIGSPSYADGANTISLTSSAGDGLMIGYATNSVTCAAGSLLTVRAFWTAISGTNAVVGLHIQW